MTKKYDVFGIKAVLLKELFELTEQQIKKEGVDSDNTPPDVRADLFKAVESASISIANEIVRALEELQKREILKE